MLRKITAALLSILLVACLMTGCLPKVKPADTTASPTTEVQTTPAETAPKTIDVTVTNKSSYVFNELYVTPTSQSDWGNDHLGSTSILKKNGSFDIKLQKYDFTNYDIKVVDEDEDIYLFKYASLVAGSNVEISFGDGLIATITGPDGSTEVVSGTLSGPSTEPEDDYDYTLEDFTFTIYNESAFDIYAIYMAPYGADEDDVVDILTNILPAGKSTEIEGSVAGTDYEGITTWQMYVVDVDDDSSVSVEEFDPWQVTYIDIRWDSDSFGYVCDFVY